MKGKIVYLHRNPRTTKVFYVGVGANRGRAYSEYSRPKAWYDIVDEHFFDVEIIAHGLSREQAFELEKFTIETLGFDSLTNNTNGGLGTSGYSHTKETKDKIREGQKRIPIKELRRRARKGWETRLKASNDFYRHRDTGEITANLFLACQKHNVKYKAEWQRQKRNSNNRIFDKI